MTSSLRGVICFPLEPTYLEHMTVINVLRILIMAASMVISVFVIAVVADVISPYHTPIEVVIEPDMIITPELPWVDNINNPDNSEFVVEVAFNAGCMPEQVTQDMFNARYR